MWVCTVTHRKQPVLDWSLLIRVFTSQVLSCSSHHLKVTFHTPFNKSTKADNPGVTELSVGSQWHFHPSSRHTQCWGVHMEATGRLSWLEPADSMLSTFLLWCLNVEWRQVMIESLVVCCCFFYIYRYISLSADNGSAVPHWFSPAYNKAYIVSPLLRSVPWLCAQQLEPVWCPTCGAEQVTLCNMCATTNSPTDFSALRRGKEPRSPKLELAASHHLPQRRKGERAGRQGLHPVRHIIPPHYSWHRRGRGILDYW